MIAVGVGSRADYAELEIIAGDPSRVFIVLNYDNLNTVVGNLTQTIGNTSSLVMVGESIISK